MLHHIVLVKSDRKDEVDDILRGLPKLLGEVPGLVGVQVHHDITGRCKGYDKLFVLEFEDQSGLDVWDEHSAHVPIRSALMEMAEMIVFDYEV